MGFGQIEALSEVVMADQITWQTRLDQITLDETRHEKTRLSRLNQNRLDQSKLEQNRLGQTEPKNHQKVFFNLLILLKSPFFSRGEASKTSENLISPNKVLIKPDNPRRVRRKLDNLSSRFFFSLRNCSRGRVRGGGRGGVFPVMTKVSLRRNLKT